MKTIIKNATVLTMNTQRDILKNTDVLIENGRIAGLGRDLADEQANTVDGTDKLVMPGLVNGHCHVPMTLLRNYADDINLQDWLFNYIFPAEDKFSGQDVHWGALVGIMEMLATGTTCFADMYFFMDDIAAAVEQSGIRAQLSKGQTNNATGVDFSSDKSMLDSIGFINQWHGAANGRITAAMAPHAVYTCSPDYIRAIKENAEKFGVPIHVHVDETRIEHEDCLKQYGKTPTRHLYDLGLFDLNAIAAHCVWVTDEDIELLKEKHISVIHNPSSNLKLASGIAPIPGMQKKGLNLALGTDGASSNNNLNLWEEIHLAAILHKGATLDPLLLKAMEVLEMATVNGAHALGLKDVGSIEAGKKADLIMVDLKKPHLKPLHKIESALVYSAQGSDVCLTMVDGRVLYEKGEFKTIDAEKVYYQLDKLFSKLFG